MSQQTVYAIGLAAGETAGLEACATALGYRYHELSCIAELGHDATRFDGACLVLGNASGSEGALTLHRAVALRTTVATLVVVERGDVPAAVEAMRHGAEGVVQRPLEAATWSVELRAAMQAVAARVAAAQAWIETLRRVEQLSAKERSVMELVLSGSPNKSIAAHLNMAQRTVERLRSLILKRLEVRTAVELARKVAEARLWAARPPAVAGLTGGAIGGAVHPLQDVA